MSGLIDFKKPDQWLWVGENPQPDKCPNGHIFGEDFDAFDNCWRSISDRCDFQTYEACKLERMTE